MLETAPPSTEKMSGHDSHGLEMAHLSDDGKVGVESRDAAEIHNKLTHIMPGQVVLRKRADIGQDSGPRGLDEENERFANEHVEGLYDTIRDAAMTPLPEESSSIYEVSARGIGSAFADLGRSYKLSQRKGLLTSYKSNYFGKNNNMFGIKSIAPTDARRIPTPVTSEDVDNLSRVSDEERIAVVAEMLDHARYRQDGDADPALREAQAREQDALISILSMLAPDYRRDLLAADAVTHFLHRRINRPDLVARSLDLISVPELRDALANTVIRLEDSSPERLVVAAHQTSSAEIERVTKSTGSYQGQTDLRLEQERALEGRATVVVNMPTENVVNLLFETFRMLPAYEAGRSGVDHMHRWDRLRDEEQLGLIGQSDLISERPIYGALVVGDREKAVGPDPELYGSCVVEIKPEVARTRTTYTYGDSLNVRRMSYDSQQSKPVDLTPRWL